MRRRLNLKSPAFLPKVFNRFPVLLSASLVFLESCGGKGKPETVPQPIDLEIAIPLSSEQAALLNGVRGTVVSVTLGTTLIEGSVRGEIVAGVRGGVRAGVRTGVRTAFMRAGGKEEPAEQDTSRSLTYRTTVGVPAGVEPGGRVVGVKVLPGTNDRTALLEVAVPIPPRKNDSKAEGSSPDAGADKDFLAPIEPQDVTLPSDNGVGLPNLVQQFAKEKMPGLGLDPSLDLKALAQDEIAKVLATLQPHLESSAKDLVRKIEITQNITINITVNASVLNVPTVTSFACLAQGVPICGNGVTINTNRLVFNFGCDRTDGCRFECSLDKGEFQACEPPVAVEGIKNGIHTLGVRATDSKGSLGAVATLFFAVETGEPVAQDGGTDGTKPTNGGTDSPDGGSSDSSGATTPTGGVGGGVIVSGGGSTTTTTSTDGSGGDSISPAVPTVTITQKPNSPSGSFVSFQFSCTTATASCGFTCSVDSGPYSGCASPKSLSGLGSGGHIFSVKAVDGIGQVSAPGSHIWTVDASTPDTTISSSPAALTGSNVASFAFSSTKTASTFECKLDQEIFSACSSPKGYSSVADGSHTFQVRAVDSLGNVDPIPASYAWTADLTPPTFGGLSSATAVSTSQINLAWSAATDNVSSSSAIIYRICQSTVAGACVSNFTATYTSAAGAETFSVTGLSAGMTYYFVVRATDGIGNQEMSEAVKSAQTTSLPTIQGVDAGSHHTCAAISTGAVKCWGRNDFGQLGDGGTTNSNSPVVVPSLNGTKVAAGGHRTSTPQSAHTCALVSAGAAKCWGNNSSGQLGNLSTTSSNTPVTVDSVSGATMIVTGGKHSMAIMGDGTVKGWGDSNFNQIANVGGGNGPPGTIAGLTGVVDLSAGWLHSCAVKSDGTMRCWGYNLYGQLGDASTSQRETPVAVVGISNALKVSAGTYHTCAVLSDGLVKCWGNNLYGMLGDGTTAQSTTPVTAVGVSGAISVAVGFTHSCAVVSNGGVKCWGRNDSGELGDGSTAQRNTAVSVYGLTGAIAIQAGGGQITNESTGHSCALLTGGDVKCWGGNDSGQLGDGSFTNRLTPVTVLNLP